MSRQPRAQLEERELQSPWLYLLFTLVLPISFIVFWVAVDVPGWFGL